MSEEKKKTEGGYEYVLDDQGNKVRNSLVGYRLKDDGETYDEYRKRQETIKNYEKQKKKGETMWPSRNYDDIRKRNPKDDPQEYMKRNLGTYNKETVQRLIDEQKEKHEG